MKINENKAKTFLVLFLVFAIAAPSFAVLPSAFAHDPPWDVPTWAYISVSPSTVGVNQPALLVMWLNSYPITATGEYGDRWDSFTVTVTGPNGSTETLGPYTSDPVGSYAVVYTPTQVGTYKFIFDFLGDTLTGEPFPPDWNPSSYGFNDINDTYLASQSDPVYLTVQQEPIQSYQESPTPTEYWTRPITGANRLWGAVASNWLNGAAQDVGPTTRFAYGTGPESSHIMWTRPYWTGGIMDERFDDNGYYTGIEYEQFWRGQPIILNGKLYYNQMTPPRYGWYCVDLTTGHEDYYYNTTGPVTGLHSGYFDSSGSIDGDSLAFGQVLDYESPNQHGGFPYLWSTGPQFDPIAPTIKSTWKMFDAFTGKYICSVNNIPTWITGDSANWVFASGFNVYGQEGSILYYGINNIAPWGAPSSYYLQCWNTTRAIWYEDTWTDNNYWMWRPDLGATFDGNNGYSLNVSIPAVQGSILAVRENQFVIGGTSGKNNGTYVEQGNLWALSLASGEEGALLWNITYTPPQTSYPDVTVAASGFGYGAMTGPTVDPEDGVFVFKEPMTRQRWGFSLATGQLLWGPTDPEPAWSFYDMSESINDGKLLSYGYSGVLIAYDIKTGSVLWNWTSGTLGFEGYYENTPLSLGCIADGKIYLFSTEHSPSTPLRRDAQLWCVNVSNGQLLWKIQHWGQSPAIADGYLVDLNLFDCQIYCYGKGPSATTITAPNTELPPGSKVLIQGTVTDIAAGTQQDEQASRFPNGVPAVSDESMTDWMQYVYMHEAKPTNVIGVQVHLTAIDPNGNFQDLGTTTSDDSGFYSLLWTPPVSGKYVVTASFEGSKSYYAASAKTAFAVSETAAAPNVVPPPAVSPTASAVQLTQPPAVTPSASPTQAVAPPASAEPTVTYIAVGAAVIAILVVAATLVLRRRK
jgi:hypothetical protein